jgi:hypothetical protein
MSATFPLLLLGTIAPREAQAYLDPGTGSFVIQALVATLVGSLFVVKTQWRRLRAFFAGRPSEDREVPRPESASQDESG